jgi:thiol-disulfide isomerase/thioredoxin
VKSSFLLNGTIAVVAAAAGYALYTGVIAPPARSGADVGAGTAVIQTASAEEAAAVVPTELPDFTLADRDGAKRSIRSWEGKSMVVNFWATWCGPCRKEIPMLKEMQKANAGAGFQVVGVAVDEREDVLKYAKEINIDYPILIGTDDGMAAVTQFGMGSIGFPFTVFTDNKHRIVTTFLGELSRADMTAILAAVSRVNAGQLTPAAARVQLAKDLNKATPSKG